MALGGQEDRLDAGELAVHRRHRQFVVEVGGGTEALDDGVHAPLPAVLGEESLPHRLHHDAAQGGQGFPGHVNAFLEREAVFLGVVRGDAHDDLVKEAGGPGNDFQVAVVDGVKGARAYGASHAPNLPYCCRGPG